MDATVVQAVVLSAAGVGQEYTPPYNSVTASNSITA